MLSISIHADPGFEYPHFIGYADERGEGKGSGLHYNFPLPARTNDEAYLKTLGQALAIIRKFQSNYLVLSAGMDIYRADKLGTFKISQTGITEIGEQIASLKLPTVVVMEGGYANDVLGKNILHLLGAIK